MAQSLLDRQAGQYEAFLADGVENPLMADLSDTQYFVVTPFKCDGSNYNILSPKKLLAAERNYLDIATKAHERAVERAVRPLMRAKDVIIGYPLDKYARRPHPTTNEKLNGQPSADRLPAHEDEGAKIIIRAAIPRYIDIPEDIVDFIITHTHENIPQMKIDKAAVKKWFKDYIDNYLKRVLDWTEVRVWLVIVHSGGMAKWRQSTAEDRAEVFTHIFNQNPLVILHGMFGQNVSSGFDFAGIFSQPSDEIKVAWQTFFERMFTELCELTWKFCMCYRGEPTGVQSAARSRRKACFKALPSDDPVMKALHPIIGCLADLPLSRISVAKPTTALSGIAGEEYHVERPDIKPMGNRKRNLKGPGSDGSDS